MTITPIPRGMILRAEHAAFYDAAKAFVVASLTDRKAASGARRRLERAFSAMKRAEQIEQQQERAA